MELEPGNPDFQPTIDRRPRLPEPLPVRLVAVENVRLPARAGLEEKLDAFYVDMFQFAPIDRFIYRADNVELHFYELKGVIPHEDMRAIGIEVPNLREAEQKLLDAQIEYIRQR